MQFLHTQNTENWILLKQYTSTIFPQCGALLTAYNSTSIMALEIFSSLIECSGDPYTYVYIHIYIYLILVTVNFFGVCVLQKGITPLHAACLAAICNAKTPVSCY